jgi:poly-beta-1,6-N-acetyl-D-glucosamine synthase
VNPSAAALFLLLWGIDLVRYGAAAVVLVIDECARRLSRRHAPSPKPPPLANAPLVSVVMAGHNEADSMPLTLRSLAEQTWPNLEVIVVDDGSSDGMSAAVRAFTACRGGGGVRAESCDPAPWLRLVTLRRRNGKAAALNTGVLLARGSFIVFVDADTSFDRDAVWEIVRPMLADPRCGAVAGNLLARNATENLLTGLTAIEYLFSISMGRRFRSLLNMLNVVSGAFGAFRRDVLEAVGGHTPTSGNDGDLTLKVRSVTERLVFADRAICRTKTPRTWRALAKQRRRWDRNLVKNKLRRHRDLLDPTSAGFRAGTAALLLDAVFFNVMLGGRWVAAFLLALWIVPHEVPALALLSYAAHLALSAAKLSAAAFVQPAPAAERVRMALLLPLFPLYKIGLRLVRLYSYWEELLRQASYSDVFAPAAVSREAMAFDDASRLRLSHLTRRVLWPWQRTARRPAGTTESCPRTSEGRSR